MKAKTQGLWLACAAMLAVMVLTSCQKGLRVLLVNNTGRNVVVIVQWSHGKSEQKTLAQGESKSFYWPLLLLIRNGSNEWKYASFPRLHRDYLEPNKFAYQLNLQIQNNGTLYMRPNWASGIVTNFLSQAPGFPLKPSAQ